MLGRWLKLTAAVALLPIVLLDAAPTAQAATLNVAAGNGADLQTKVKNAASGDLVVIPAGLYEVPCGSDNGVLEITNVDLTLRGPATGTATIRPAPGCLKRVIRIVDTGSPNSITIENVTITGGRPAGSGNGAGISASFQTATTLTIRDSIITDNEAGDDTIFNAPSGGGVYLNSLGTLVIERSMITNNHVGLGGDLGSGAGPVRGWRAGGGGVAFRGFDTPTGSVTITDSTISGNTGGIDSLGGGGGLWLDSRDVTLTDVVVQNNTLPGGRSSGDGAGIAIQPRVPGPVDVTITRGNISGNTIGAPDVSAPANTVGGQGGGLWIEAPGGTVTITGTDFADNAAGDARGNSVGGDGGNVFIGGFAGGTTTPYTISFDGVDLVRGTAGSSPSGNGGDGGGAHVDGPVAGSTISITDSTFDDNTAGDAGSSTSGGSGGGLYAQVAMSGAVGSISVQGSTFTGNRAGDGGPTGGGGGFGGGARLAVFGTSGTAPMVSVTGSQFVDNVAGDGQDGGQGGSGGGLNASAARTRVAESTFSGNRAGDAGAGTAGGRGGSGGGAWIFGATADVVDTTFSSNVSGNGGDATSTSGGNAGNGGGLLLDVSADATVDGGSFVGNRTGSGGNGGPDGATPRAGAGGAGGGLRVDHDGGTLSLTGVTMRANVAGNAGNGGASAAARSSVGGFGGGLAVEASNLVDIDVTDSTFDQNRAGDGGSAATATSSFGGSGGGIQVRASGAGSSLTIERSVISDNVSGSGADATGAAEAGAPGGSGGGVSALLGTPTSGSITIVRSAVTGNVTGGGGNGGAGSFAGRGGAGGGLWLDTGSGAGSLVRIENTTVANNATGRNVAASPGDASPGDAGGIYVDTDTRRLEIEHATLTGNTGNNGDNLQTGADVTELTANVLVDPGNGNNGINCQLNSGSVLVSGGFNIGCGFGGGGSTDILTVTSDVLGPLQDNGGVGLSRIPKIAGPGGQQIFDRVPAAQCGLAVDQLGVARPQGAGCEPGAVEANPEPITAIGDVLRVGGGPTPVPFLDNDDLAGFTPADVTVTIVEQPGTGVLFREGGEWTFQSTLGVGEFTRFSYRACLGQTTICDEAEVTLVPDGLSRFVSLPPARIFDTRPNQPGNGPKGFVQGGETIDVQITGVAGVPANGVSAVAMNVTATQSDGPGFVTVFPTGTTQPVASNLNLVGPGQTIPNFVIVPVGAGGKVSMFSLSGVHLLADVAGYFTENGISQNAAAPGSDSGRLVPLTPSRVFDTRPSQQAPGPKGLVGPDSAIDVQIAGRGGVPTSGVAAVVMNLTATAASAPGFVTAWPTGSPQPLASNLNVGPGEAAPNLVIVPLGVDGKISLYSLSALHLLGDVTGYITDGSAPTSLSGLFTPSDPRRVFDTRENLDPPGNKGFVAADSSIDVRFTRAAGTPETGVGAVAINATAAGAAAPGFVTAWPTGQTRPLASTLNLSFAGQTRPNAAILPVGNGGRLSFYTLQGVDLLADAFGWFLE